MVRQPSRESPETSLYAAAKRHLEAQGYAVKGEVCGCDGVGIRQGDGGADSVAIIELKLSFTLDLVLQAVDRMAAADCVWLAVPMSRRGRDQDRRVHKLCRLMGVGLLAVHPSRRTVEVLAEPAPYQPRRNRRRRDALIKEHRSRAGDPNSGGSTKVPIMTAYRQRSLACAAAILEQPRRPKDLRQVAPDAGRILLSNVYGWFARVERGLYGLTPDGEAALRRWPIPAGRIVVAGPTIAAQSLD